MGKKLFSEVEIRGVRFRNRVGMSPMCMYSAKDGMISDWHIVHLGSRAIGGAGFIVQEATAVSPEGRISPDDCGIWNDEQMDAYKRVTDFVKKTGAAIGLQLAHAGRKASECSPLKGEGALTKDNGGWDVYAPSAIRFDEKSLVPIAMSKADINKVKEDFINAAIRSVGAGFQFIEMHFAHGYLVNQFLSPLSNVRTDEYGGSFENRCRLAIEIVQGVRKVIPESMPLFVRLSVTEWVDGGWNADDSVELARKLKAEGVDLIDCSSGGNNAGAKIPVSVGYQVPLSRRVKSEADIMTAAVGLITSPEQAEQIIEMGDADVVLLGRELLRNPYWCLSAARKLRQEVSWVRQYLRSYEL